ncbi:3-dehydroquinate synthase [Thermococcus henrietii]|uniref:3-dehydroquinate synthase n=1 Tax=Thermococcus henrietii TaxID=2016361 RepID=UPI000C080D6F|nr:3-dehydroquinate synthase [Thermococcus henrietii]
MEGVKFGTLSDLSSLVSELSPYRTVVLTNTTVERLWLGKLEGIDAETIVIPDGEEHKNIETVKEIWARLQGLGFTRKSLLIGLGGGVITDIAGFVASTYMRGTMLGLVPTTLLAQVDAAIGGKTGVNFNGKNMIGTFYLPDFVLIAHETLSTLPREELLNGMAEVVKYGVLDGNVHSLLKRLDSVDDVNPELVRACAGVKLRVVEEDLREGGKRRVLNLGHTTAHAIEKLSNYTIKHGFAVSIGLMVAAKVGETMYGFDPGKVGELLEKFGLPTRLPFEPDEVLREMRLDKKSWYGKLTFVVPVDIGEVTVEEVEEDVVRRALEAVR